MTPETNSTEPTASELLEVALLRMAFEQNEERYDAIPWPEGHDPRRKDLPQTELAKHTDKHISPDVAAFLHAFYCKDQPDYP